MTEHRDKLFAAIKGLRTSGAQSDFTFTCGTEVHAVHKAIICARSGNFARAVKFKGVEAAAANINFLPDEDDPKLVKLMVQYMYEARYDLEPSDSTATARSAPRRATNFLGRAYSYDFPHACDEEWEGDDVYCSRTYICPHHHCGSQCNINCKDFVCQVCESRPTAEPKLSLHAGMAMIADKYDVYGLGDLARSNFRKDYEAHWNTSEFMEAAKYVCDVPVEALKAVIIDTIVAHKELINKAGIKEVLKKSDGFALEILGRMAD